MYSYFYSAFIAVLLSFNLFTPAQAVELNHTKQAIIKMIVEETRNKVSLKDVKRIVNAVFKESDKQNVDPFLIVAVLGVESTFNPSASNKSGARGLGQVIPKWHRDKIRGRDIMNIETNVEVSTQVFVDCLDKGKNSIYKASGCYSSNAKNFASKLKRIHTKAKKADLLYRLQNDLPLVVVSHFESPKTFSISVSAEPQTQTLEDTTLLAASSPYSNFVQ